MHSWGKDPFESLLKGLPPLRSSSSRFEPGGVYPPQQQHGVFPWGRSTPPSSTSQPAGRPPGRHRFSCLGASTTTAAARFSPFGGGSTPHSSSTAINLRGVYPPHQRSSTKGGCTPPTDPSPTFPAQISGWKFRSKFLVGISSQNFQSEFPQ